MAGEVRIHTLQDLRGDRSDAPRTHAEPAHGVSFVPLHPSPVAAMPDPQQAELHGAAGHRVAELRQLDRPAANDPGAPGHDPRAEAAAIIAEARDAARTMLAQARDVVAAERDRATRDGFDVGRRQGRADADAEMQGLIATCDLIGAEVAQSREQLLREREGEVVELAIAIAERIVGASLAIDPDLVVESCRGAMRRAFQRDDMQVLAHPDDLDRLRAAGPQLARELGGIEHLDFVEERRITPGSIIVRTPAGEIDATISGKAAVIEASLRELVEARRATSEDHGG